MALPRAYAAVLFSPPTSSTSVGGSPEYITRSSNATATSIRSPAPYALSFEDTDTTDGALVSTAISFSSPSDPPDPGGGRARPAGWPVAVPVIVPAPDRVLAPGA